MPRIDLQQLPDDSRIWLFGISPQLDDAKRDTLTAQVDGFLDQWASHGTPITGAAAVVDHTFLVVGIDKQAEASGCSIDRMFGLLRSLERDLGVKILDSDRVFFRHGDGRIDASTPSSSTRPPSASARSAPATGKSAPRIRGTPACCKVFGARASFGLPARKRSRGNRKGDVMNELEGCTSCGCGSDCQCGAGCGC